jgi:stage V sporulation protein AC
MNMTNREYNAYVQKISPPSKMWQTVPRAFVSGGALCCVGQALMLLYGRFDLTRDDTAAAASITMVFLGALLTGLGFYDRLARFSGAGTLVPITGFANSVVSPALEFKSEGFVTGTAAKMFVIAGPVIVFGMTASVVYGLALVLLN